MDLDFSALSDDQIVTLVRAALREIAARSPATQAAMRDALLDESERARLAAAATAAEVGAIRARERQRVSEEAAAAVRAAHAKQAAELDRRQAASQAEAARVRQAAIERTARLYLTRAAALVGHTPAQIAIALADTRYGRRAMINLGSDRYARDHLVDYSVTAGTIKTERGLISRKPDLAALLAEIAALNPARTLHICGADYSWES